MLYNPVMEFQTENGKNQNGKRKGNEITMSDYGKTKKACYLGFITQAITANFAPLLFLKFHHDYQISLGNIAWISTCFFFTQLLVDLFCAKFVDRIGYRVCIVAADGTVECQYGE